MERRICQDPPHELHKETKTAHYKFRSAQRLQECINREKSQQELMQAPEGGIDTFHTIIKRHRSQPTQQVNELIYNDVRHAETPFGKTIPHAQPSPNAHFEDEHLMQCKEEIEHIRLIDVLKLSLKASLSLSQDMIEATKLLNNKNA